MKKICFMHRASIGDMLLVTPIYRAVKESFPSVETVLVTSKTGYEMLYGNPYIDVLISYEKGDNFFPVIKKIWRADAAIIFDFAYRNALAAFLALIPKRIGGGKDFINIRIPEISEFSPSYSHARLLKPLGIEVKNLDLVRPVVTPEEKVHVREIYSEITGEDKKLIILAPYSLSYIKDWPTEKYREIIRRFNETGKYSVAVLGGKNQKKMVEESFPGGHNLAGRLNLRESAEIISLAALHISGCTSMLHFCASTDTPSLAIYGSTDSDYWAPKKNCTVINHKFPCSPCYNIPGKIPCEGIPKCLDDISVDEVFDMAKKILENR